MGSYMDLFDAALAQEDFDKAAGYLARIGELHPDSPVLEEREQRIEAAKTGAVGPVGENGNHPRTHGFL